MQKNYKEVVRISCIFEKSGYCVLSQEKIKCNEHSCRIFASNSNIITVCNKIIAFYNKLQDVVNLIDKNYKSFEYRWNRQDEEFREAFIELINQVRTINSVVDQLLDEIGSLKDTQEEILERLKNIEKLFPRTSDPD